MFRFLVPSNWFGPLFRFELLRLMRRGLHYRLRCVLGFVLLVVLFILYWNWFPRVDPVSLLLGSETLLEPNATARFSEAFVFALLMMQLGVVVLLTPPLAAGSIIEEYQKRTITFLLATDLSSREIVLGKLAARLVFILGILLMFLPVMALMQLWGGVDIARLLDGYVVIVLTMLSLGALSVHFAIAGRSLGHALFQAYSVFAFFSLGALCCLCISPYLTVASPFASLWALFEYPDSVGDNPLIFAGCAILWHGTLTILGLAGAVTNMRRRGPARPGVQPWPRELTPAELEKINDLPNSVAQAADPTEANPGASPLFGNGTSPEISSALPSEPAPAGQLGPEPRQTGMSAPQLPFEPAPRQTGMSAPPLGDPPGALPKKDRDVFRIGEREPLAWKEAHFPKILTFSEMLDWLEAQHSVLFLGFIVMILLGGCAVMVLFSLTCAWLATGESLGPVYNPIVRWLGLVLLACWLLAAAMRAAASVARERANQTLETLLTLPVDRRRILAAKWKSCLGCGKEFGVALAILGGIGVMTTGLFFAAVIPAAVLAIVMRRFGISLGLWLSTRCRSSVQAIVWLMVVLIGLSFVPVITAEITGTVLRYAVNYKPDIDIEVRRVLEREDQTAQEVEAFLFDMNPISCWGATTFYWGDLESHHSNLNLALRLLSAAVATLFLWCLSGLLWVDGCRRFEKEGRS